MASKRSKLRAEFRKNHQGRVRDGDLTSRYTRQQDHAGLDEVPRKERVSGKGELTRKRTITGTAAEDDPKAAQLAGHDQRLRGGRVLSVHGLRSKVLADDGSQVACTLRQVLKSLSTDQRNVIATGDRVRFLPDGAGGGVIERIEPRHGVLSRTSGKRRHVIVTNVDLLLIVTSCAQPALKPALIDRFLLSAQQHGIQPLICFNKLDLADAARIQQVVGAYAQLGYLTLMTSAALGTNVEYLRALLRGKQTAVVGQSGVGKSSLLNAIQPALGLRIGQVSQENQKGKHTTTAATLIPMHCGGAVVDTPGIRQFQLWDITADEVAALMPDMRPYVCQCRYQNCLHLNEDQCAVKNAVADGRIDARRYDAYCHLLEEELGLA